MKVLDQDHPFQPPGFAHSSLPPDGAAAKLPLVSVEYDVHLYSVS